jgi:hypothetical protein
VIYRVVVTARANADAIAAFRWKTEVSAKIAERWYAGLEKAIAKRLSHKGNNGGSGNVEDA